MDARIHEIGKLFQTQCRLLVPLYQRTYVWTQQDQWEPFWGDIRRLANELLANQEPRPHFLGAVVVDVDPRPIGYLACHTVVDGQQRLTTIQLFLEALADNYERLCAEDDDARRGYAERFAKLARSLTRNTNLAEEDADGEFKVWPMNADQAAFRAVMEAGSPEDLDQAQRDNPAVLDSRLAAAYRYFYSAIRDWLLTQDDLKSAVEKLFDVVQRHVQIAVIDLQNSVDPQLIFETLNARGTPLDPSDLVKNFLFHQAALQHLDAVALYARNWAQFDTDRAYWDEVVGRGTQRRKRLDMFMYHYLTMQVRDDVQMRRLYPEYRAFAGQTRLTVVEQLESIRYYAHIYRTLDNLPATSTRGTFMYRLGQMDASTVMPFVLLVVGDKSLPEDDKDAILADIESYLVRRMVCQLTAKAYNRLFVDLLSTINEKGLTPQIVRAQLLKWGDPTNEWPNDERLHTAWMTYPMYSWIAQARIRTVLEALEPMMRSDKAEQVMLIQETLTIEHLMPQTWMTHYPLPEGVDPEKAQPERDRIIHTFGNLTLVTQKLNPSISNGPWCRLTPTGMDKGKRAEILRHSNLALNSMLVDCETWDEDGIRKRGERLFEGARKLWPYPSPMSELPEGKTDAKVDIS